MSDQSELMNVPHKDTSYQRLLVEALIQTNPGIFYGNAVYLAEMIDVDAAEQMIRSFFSTMIANQSNTEAKLFESTLQVESLQSTLQQSEYDRAQLNDMLTKMNTQNTALEGRVEDLVNRLNSVQDDLDHYKQVAQEAIVMVLQVAPLAIITNGLLKNLGTMYAESDIAGVAIELKLHFGISQENAFRIADDKKFIALIEREHKKEKARIAKQLRDQDREQREAAKANFPDKPKRKYTRRNKAE